MTFKATDIATKEFWDKGIPIRSKFVEAGFQTAKTRWSRDTNVDFMVRNFDARHAYVQEFGFAIPCREIIERIANLSKNILEVGAGSGFLASQLTRFGVDVIATDLKPVSEYKFKTGKHYPIVHLPAKAAILKYRDRDVLSSWPDYADSWLYEAVQYMKPGRLLFYIGEGSGGCTADDQFHEFVENENEFEILETVSMVQFYGINDDLTIYRRKERVRCIP